MPDSFLKKWKKVFLHSFFCFEGQREEEEEEAFFHGLCDARPQPYSHVVGWPSFTMGREEI